MSIVESIQQAIDNFKSTMRALKIAAIAGLGLTGGYVANEALAPQVEPEKIEVVADTPEATSREEVAPVKFDESTVGAKPLVRYRVTFGWDYIYMLKVDDEVVPLVISGPGKPSYEASVKVPGYTKEIRVPMESTSYEVATRMGPPSESLALALVRSRGEKVLPPRKARSGDRVIFAGLVGVDVLEVID